MKIIVQNLRSLCREIGATNLAHYLMVGDPIYLNGGKLDATLKEQQPIELLMSIIRECQELPEGLHEVYQGLKGKVPDPAWNLAHYLAIGDPTYLQEFKRKDFELRHKRLETVAEVVRRVLN